MIGKCMVLFCAALGIAAGSCIPQCSCQMATPVIPSAVVSNCGCGGFGSSCGGIIGGGIIGGGCGGGIIGGGCGCGCGVSNIGGPETSPLPVIQAPPVTLPTVQTPVIPLPSQPIPAPRVISQRCVCTKTVVKPQVIQRQVTVPKVQRYLKRTVTPVVENVSYKTRPVTYQRGCSAPIACRSSYSRLC